MPYLIPILLVCATWRAIDCQPDTGKNVDVLYPLADHPKEDYPKDIIECGKKSQYWIANSALKPDMSKGEYLKIMCKRPNPLSDDHTEG